MIYDVCWFLVTVMTLFVLDYAFCKINQQYYDINKKKLILVSLISIGWVITDKYLKSIPRPIISASFSIFMFYLLYKKTFSKNLLTYLVIFIVMMIVETIFIAIFVYLFGINVNFFEYDLLGIFIVNTFIALSTIYFMNIMAIRKLFIKIITWYDEKRFLKFISIILIAYGLIAYFTYLNYSSINSILYVVGVNIILILIMVFVIGFFNEHAENHKLLIEYDRQMIYVKTYEQLANDKQKEQHEYRNQLSLIRSMAESHDKKIISYIDELLEIDSQNQSHQYFEQLTHIPRGGLKGFILFKINEMIDLDIEVLVNVDEALKDETCWEVCDKELKDVSRAIGVYLDNAKEAASLAQQKFVIIDVSKEEEKIIFTFSNTFKGELDVLKFGIEGYSTKGSTHGHGLALIKEIIEHNKHLESFKYINGIYYVQGLIIK